MDGVDLLELNEHSQALRPNLSKDVHCKINSNGYDGHNFLFGYVDEKNPLPIVSPVNPEAQVPRCAARSGRGSPFHSLGTL